MTGIPPDFVPPHPYVFVNTITPPFTVTSGSPSVSLDSVFGNPGAPPIPPYLLPRTLDPIPYCRSPDSQDHIRDLAATLTQIILSEIERDPEGMSNGKSKASFTVETDPEDVDSPRYIGSEISRPPSPSLESGSVSPVPPQNLPNPLPIPMNIDSPHVIPAAQSSAFATSDPVRTAVDHQIDLVFDYFEHRRPGLLIENPGLSIGEPMNPLLAGTTFAAAYTFLSGLTAAPNRPIQVEDSKFLFSRLLPIFSVIQNYSQGALFDANIQSVGRYDKVHPETDFIFMEKRHYDAHIADTESKIDDLPIRPLNGYPIPKRIRREEIQFAETARRSLHLTIDGRSTTSPPIPAHLLNNSIALRRYLEHCLPGTPFFENCPAEVTTAREAFQACLLCGLFHVNSTLMCSTDKLAERALIAEKYELVQSYQSLYFAPAFLREDMDRHHFHYRSVYPGSYFLFSRVPPAIATARYNFKVCQECGLLHKTGFTANSYACPYPLQALAEAAITEHSFYETRLAFPSFPGAY